MDCVDNAANGKAERGCADGSAFIDQRADGAPHLGVYDDGLGGA